MTAFESTHTFSPHPAIPHDISILGRTRKLQLADTKDNSKDLPIEFLIGGDHYWNIVKDTSPIRLSPSVVLLPSKSGWILSGNSSTITVSMITVNYVNLEQTFSLSDDVIHRFWDLETLGIKDIQDKSLSARDSTLLREFRASYSIDEDRRVVSLPRKGGITIPSNRHNAEKLFYTLEQRLERNGALQQVYHALMLVYVWKKQVEIVPPGEEATDVYYLPHHAVKKEKQGDTKWRIVFDRSPHEDHAPSLKEALEMGPNLLPEILGTLLRFRLYPVGLIGDISQAFLQISLDRKDRDLTRFLWYRVTTDGEGNYNTTEDVITNRFIRLPFGLTCSPFLLSATIRELAEMYKSEFPTVANLVDSSTFMDDFAAGAENDDAVINLYYELTSLMNQIQLPMAKWATNSPMLKEVWKPEDLECKVVTQVLGIGWNTESDTLSTDPPEMLQKDTQKALQLRDKSYE
jgi:hypothetical protein